MTMARHNVVGSGSLRMFCGKRSIQRSYSPLRVQSSYHSHTLCPLQTLELFTKSQNIHTFAAGGLQPFCYHHDVFYILHPHHHYMPIFWVFIFQYWQVCNIFNIGMLYNCFGLLCSNCTTEHLRFKHCSETPRLPIFKI